MSLVGLFKPGKGEIIDLPSSSIYDDITSLVLKSIFHLQSLDGEHLMGYIHTYALMTYLQILTFDRIFIHLLSVRWVIKDLICASQILMRKVAMHVHMSYIHIPEICP